MGEKETMAGDALRESPTRASQGRDAATGQASGKTSGMDDWDQQDVTSPRDVATGQSSGRMAPSDGGGMPVVKAPESAAAADWDIKTQKGT